MLYKIKTKIWCYLKIIRTPRGLKQHVVFDTHNVLYFPSASKLVFSRQTNKVSSNSIESWPVRKHSPCHRAQTILIFELSRYLGACCCWEWSLWLEIVSSHYSMKNVTSEKLVRLWIRTSVLVQVPLSNYPMTNYGLVSPFRTMTLHYDLLVCLSPNDHLYFYLWKVREEFFLQHSANLFPCSHFWTRM